MTIEDQKRTEERPWGGENELRELIENVPAMVYVTLPGPSNAFASRRWLDYAGLSQEETKGLGWQGACHPEDLQRHMEKWRAYAEQGEPFEDEVRFRRAADGEYRWFLVRAVPIRDESGNLLKWYGAMTDIEDRKQTEQSLRQSEAARLRLEHLAREFELSLEVRVAERTRIARELHDTLLQSFQGLVLRFQTVSDLLSTRPAEARKILSSAIEQAASAITEGREAVQGLRISAEEPNDLAAAIGALGKKLAADSATNPAPFLRVAVEGAVRPLDPIIRDEIYRVAGEALRNAFQHSQGTQIEVELRYDERQFRLRVRDDGQGIDAKVMAEGSREGHYGLRGMRERAEVIGGELRVWSVLGAGTEIELTIVASHAYAKARLPRDHNRSKP